MTFMTYMNKMKHISILLLILIVFFSGCMNTNTKDIEQGLEDTSQEDVENVLENISSRYPDYNIIIISIDTLRADHLGTYGYDRNTSPTIDSIAKEGIVFENTFAVVGETWPSLTSTLTSLYPVSTNVRTNGQILNDSFITLPEILKEHNYSSMAFLSNFCKAGNYGFDNKSCGRDGKITKDTLKWLDKNYDNKFFLWVHYLKPHQPYNPPEKYASLFVDSNYTGNYTADEPTFGFITKNRINLTDSDLNYIISLYDGDIRYADDQVKEVYQKLETLGLLDNSIIIITSDHGEDLYQHNYFFLHSCSIYDSSLHIPLIIRLPDKSVINKRVENVVSNVDIAPTLLELANISPPPFFEGTSLVPLIFSSDNSWEDIALSERGRNIQVSIQSIRTPKWRYVYNPKNLHPICMRNNTGGVTGKHYYPIEEEELYNIAQDPDETTNVVSQYPEVASSLREELLRRYKPNKLLNETGAPIEADEETKEELRALGYVV